MDEKKVLLPYNFTESDEKALDFVMENYAENKNIIVTVLHFYSQVPEIVLNRNSVMEKMSDGMHYLRARSKEQEEKIIAVKQRLLDNGLGNVNYLFSPKKKVRVEGVEPSSARLSHYFIELDCFICYF